MDDELQHSFAILLCVVNGDKLQGRRCFTFFQSDPDQTAFGCRESAQILQGTRAWLDGENSICWHGPAEFDVDNLFAGVLIELAESAFKLNGDLSRATFLFNRIVVT